MNEATQRLFKVIEEGKLTPSQFEAFISTSLMMQDIPSAENLAVALCDALERADVGGRYYYHLTPLSCAIVYKRREYIDVLLNILIKQLQLQKITQAQFDEVLLHSAGCAVEANPDVFEVISDCRPEILNQKLTKSRHKLPLGNDKVMINSLFGIAIKFNRMNIIKLLLLAGVNPLDPVSYDGRYSALDCTAAGSESWKLLTVVCRLQKVISLKKAQNILEAHQTIIEALTCHTDFAIDYIANLTEKAINQLADSETDQTDYRYLLSILPICSYLLAQEPDKKNYDKFQASVVVHLYGAYDCSLQVSPGKHKLFADEEQKNAFFKTPLHSHSLLTGIRAAFVMTEPAKMSKTEVSKKSIFAQDSISSSPSSSHDARSREKDSNFSGYDCTAPAGGGDYFRASK